MKKNIMRKVLLSLLMLFVFPLGVYADSVSIKCPDEIIVGMEVSCDLYGTTLGIVNSVDMTVAGTDKLSVVSFAATSDWGMSDFYNGRISVLSADNIEGTFKIGVLKVKSSDVGNNNITINSILFGDEKGIEKSVDPVSKVLNVENETVNNTGGNNGASGNNATGGDNNQNTGNDKEDNKVSDDNEVENKDENLSSDSYLADLTITGYDINFDREVYEYTLTINDDQLDIIPEVQNENAKYTVSGNSNLQDGSVIQISVVAEDGSSSIYKINIVRENNTNNIFKMVMIGIIVVLVLINIIRLFKSNRSKKNEEDN